ncbi:helix-turn-helix transcriptional regulator [bacterium]|nr:helix-turn-helix transcriptional regulator [bacterium]
MSGAPSKPAAVRARRADPVAAALARRRFRNPQGWEYRGLASAWALRRLNCIGVIGRSVCPPGFCNRHEDENGYLLHYVRRGSLEHLIRGRRQVAIRGDAVLMDLDGRVEYRTSGREPVDLYWVTFSGPDLAWWFQELRAGSAPLFRGIDGRSVDSLFRQLIQRVSRPQSGREARVSGLLVCLLAELMVVRDRGTAGSFLVQQTRLLSEPIRAVLDQMALGYDHAVAIKEYAVGVGLRSSHLVERFHHEVGITPAAWLARYRIDQAQQLLERSQRPIGEIGRLVGLPAPNHFARLFRRITGLTPRQFRQRRGRRR